MGRTYTWISQPIAVYFVCILLFFELLSQSYLIFRSVVDESTLV